jgi:hypothetical protein
MAGHRYLLNAVLLSVAISSPAIAGTWKRLNVNTLQFRGDILSDEFDRFQQSFDPQVRELIVDSGGGDTVAGLKIGMAMRAAGVNVTVHHWCFSSCANYLFLGGKLRRIQHGVVGYHGNMNALISPGNLPGLIADLKRQGLTDDQIAQFIREYQQQASIEARFFSDMGVSQALFDRTFLADKGMGDGKEYEFLLPKQETFKRYGVRHVIGIQDRKIANDWLKEEPGYPPLVID